MAQSQDEIDALLANVSQLAAETAADIIGQNGAPAGPAPPPRAAGPASAPPKRRQVPSSQPAVSPASEQRAPDPQRILQLEVPVIVTLASRTMPLSKILALSPGSIIEFEKPSEELLELMINNRCIGRGQAVKVGENFGLRVVAIDSMKDRVEAMGPR